MNRLLIVAGLVSALLPAGCGRHKPKPAMPPLQVETARAVTDSIPNRMSFIGYLSSNFDAVIQPRINGFLLSKRFSNGMPVKRGQLLFTIDPDQLSTTMLAAEAALQSAKAQALEAQNNYERAVPLAKINAISQAQLDQYTAQYKAAEASVRSAEQTLSSARMNVGYTELRSPIDGIIEHTAAHVGDYVGPRHAVQRADEHFEYRHADRRCGHSDGRIPQGGRRTRFDLRQRGAALGHSPDAGRRHALPLRGTLRLHAQGRVEQHGNARAGGDVPQPRPVAQTRTVRPRLGQRRPRTAAGDRAPAERQSGAGRQFGLGRTARRARRPTAAWCWATPTARCGAWTRGSPRANRWLRQASRNCATA